MIEVQVAVGGDADVGDLRPDDGQRLRQFHPARPVVGIRLRVGAHAGVEQDRSAGMIDEVTETRVHPGTASPGLLRRPHEVAEIDAPDRDVSHHAMIPLQPEEAARAGLT
jgi:hypothetical protein